MHADQLSAFSSAVVEYSRGASLFQIGISAGRSFAGWPWRCLGQGPILTLLPL